MCANPSSDPPLLNELIAHEEELSLLPNGGAMQKESNIANIYLNGEQMICFEGEGEARLCFQPFSTRLLHNITYERISAAIKSLNIHLEMADKYRMDCLKSVGAIPLTSPHCALIRLTDAERLISVLTERNFKNYNISMNDSTIDIYHECFGYCEAKIIVNLNSSERISCNQCKRLFNGENFIFHTHSHTEVHRVVHWGFNRQNWRHYIYLHRSLRKDSSALQYFNIFIHGSDFRSSFAQKRSADLKTIKSDEPTWKIPRRAASDAVPDLQSLLQRTAALPNLQLLQQIPCDQLFLCLAAARQQQILQNLNVLPALPVDILRLLFNNDLKDIQLPLFQSQPVPQINALNNLINPSSDQFQSVCTDLIRILSENLSGPALTDALNRLAILSKLFLEQKERQQHNDISNLLKLKQSMGQRNT